MQDNIKSVLSGISKLLSNIHGTGVGRCTSGRLLAKQEALSSISISKTPI
jgi:hypothetical protein